MANDSDVWKCHPDLEMEWKEFVSDSRASVGNDLNSDLWMNYWRSEIPSAKTNHTAVYSLISPPESEEVMSYESSGQNMKIILSSDNEEGVGPQEAQEVLLSESQCQHIQSISCDLVDALDMTCENIPSDLKDDMRSLSPSEMVFLFKELQSKLSDQGAYALCSLLTEDADVREWVNIAIVFEGLFLYKLQQCGLKSINQELLASLKQLAVHFPTECVSSFLKPLIICEMSPIHLELVSGLVPLLPEKDFSSLFQHVVGTCKTPIEEQMISILNCLLSDGRAHVFESRTESPLLDLLPILSSSARALSASESFASLLLKVIPVLRKNPSSKVKNELLAVVQLNTSFSNQILMDALS